MDEIKDTIRRRILTNILEADLDEPLANDRSLINGVILDSISVASLMSFLEDRYDIVVDADDRSDGSMNTIDAIAAMVKT